MREGSGSKLVNMSNEMSELTDAELGVIAGGDALEGYDLLSHAMGGSKVIDNLVDKLDMYYRRV